MFLLYHLDIACHGPNGFDDIKLIWIPSSKLNIKLKWKPLYEMQIIFRAAFPMVFPHLCRRLPERVSQHLDHLEWSCFISKIWNSRNSRHFCFTHNPIISSTSVDQNSPGHSPVFHMAMGHGTTETTGQGADRPHARSTCWWTLWP